MFRLPAKVLNINNHKMEEGAPSSMHAKTAFTIVELIFVIVILGILSAIAVTKLNATRQDAKIAVLHNKITAAIDEISSYAMANKKIEGNVSTFSNIFDEMEKSGDATYTYLSDSILIHIKSGEETNCVLIKINTEGPEQNLSVLKGAESSDVLCNRLQKLLVDKNTSIILRGQYAKF